MSVSDVEADSVVFHVRDRLRLQTQTASSDALSAHAASRVLKTGRNIAFDPSFSLPDTYHACGNHYVLKTGSNGSCSSCRSSVPVWQGVYVYLEFSITSQSDNNPSSFVSGPVDLSIGLIPADCPPNVSAGQWPNSIGLLSSGKLLVAGRECQFEVDPGGDGSIPAVQVAASTTIGMLIYIPKCGQDTDSYDIDPSVRPSPAQKAQSISDRRPVFPDQDYDDIDTLGFEDSESQSSAFEHWKPPDADIFNVTDTEGEKNHPMTVNKNESFSVKYNMNGRVVDMSPSSQSFIAENIRDERNAPQLYAVVSLMSKNCGSWCRFSESDVVYKSRREIGAPVGHRVYCLDGSLLLDCV